MFKVKNEDPNKEKQIAFRFVINDVKEIEENGVLSGILLPGRSNDMQLMVTKPGYLNLTLMACDKKLAVYKAKATYLKNKLKESEEIIGRDMSESKLSYYSHNEYISNPGPLYIRIENQDTETATYTLVSRIHDLTSNYMVGGLFKILPVKRFYESEDLYMLTVEAVGPAFNKANLDLIFSNVTDIQISLSVILYASSLIDHSTSQLALNKFKYCPANLMKGKGYYQGEANFTVTIDKYLDAQQPRNITIKLDDELVKKLTDQKPLLDIMQTKAAMIIRIKVDLYEDLDFYPVATFIDFSDPTYLPPGSILTSTKATISSIQHTSSSTTIILISIISISILSIIVMLSSKLSCVSMSSLSSMETDQSTTMITSIEMIDESIDN